MQFLMNQDQIQYNIDIRRQWDISIGLTHVHIAIKFKVTSSCLASRIVTFLVSDLVKILLRTISMICWFWRSDMIHTEKECFSNHCMNQTHVRA